MDRDPQRRAGLTFAQRVERFKQRVIVRAMRMAGGSVPEAARLLGLSANSMHVALTRRGLRDKIEIRRSRRGGRRAKPLALKPIVLHPARAQPELPPDSGTPEGQALAAAHRKRKYYFGVDVS